MNTKAQTNMFIIGRFIIFVFILVLLYMFFSPILGISDFSMEEMVCSENYTFICFLAQFTLPLLFIIIFLLAIKYLVGRD